MRRMLVLAILLAGRAFAAEADADRSPLALAPSPDGRSLYVAESGARAIAVVDVAKGEVARRIELPGSPLGVAVSRDGSRLYVSLDGPDAQVLVVETASGKVASAIPVGHTAMSPVQSPDGKRLFVCNRFHDSVSVLDLEGGKETARVPVGREPVAAALTPDGGALVVAHLLPAGPANRGWTAAVVSFVDPGAGKVVAEVKLPNGSTGVHGLALSPDGRYAYAAHLLAHYSLPTTQVERGWMNTNALSILDVPARALVGTVLLDRIDRGAANPWGVGVSADGRHLVVAQSGTHDLSVIDRTALHARVAKAGGADLSRDFTVLSGIRRRVPLAGKGPRGLAVLGGEAWAAEYFSDSLGRVPLEPGATARSVPLGPPRTPSEVRRGEILFHDAQRCLQAWQSCASCHPGARVDGLVWDLLNDGLGNPKSTKSMLFSHETPPVMSLGIRKDAELAERKGFHLIQFATVDDTVISAVSAYLRSLAPVPSPRRVKGELGPAARRGEAVFNKVGCASCHPAPLYTDLKSYAVGWTVGPDAGKPFDTPTLREVWRTGPYWHDGHAATVRELLEGRDTGDRHGTAGKLSPKELDDLVEYVLSL